MMYSRNKDSSCNLNISSGAAKCSEELSVVQSVCGFRSVETQVLMEVSASGMWPRNLTFVEKREDVAEVRQART